MLILFLAITIYSFIYKIKVLKAETATEQETPEDLPVFKVLPEDKYNSIFLFNGFW